MALHLRSAFVAAVMLATASPVGLYAQVAPRAETATWITLGTGGGPEIRTERSQPANALVIGDAVYLFEVGSGVETQMVKAGISLPKVRVIFISHHHIDHNADLNQLLVSRWVFSHYKPIRVIGPPGTKDMVASLIEADRPIEAAPVSGGQVKPPIASTVEATDLPLTADEPVEVYRDANIRVLAITNAHYNFPPDDPKTKHARSYSFRIEAGGRTIAFTGDTGPSANVVRLAQGADMLVSEVVDTDKTKAQIEGLGHLPAAAVPFLIKRMSEEHLTPTEVAKLASKARVGKVVLTHVAPGRDGEPDPSSYTRGMSAIYKGPIILAKDLDRF